MASNRKIAEKKAITESRKAQKDHRSMGFYNQFVAMKNRQGWNYRKPGV